MRKILDFYFRIPVKIDYILAFSLLLSIRWGMKHELMQMPEKELITAFASETTTVLLTLSGFILTFLTVLIALKSNAVDKLGGTSTSVMDLFCNSTLYDDTVSLLKNCIKSLVFVTLMVYVVRLVKISNIEILYFTIVFAIMVMLLTILRSLFILDGILRFHNKK